MTGQGGRSAYSRIQLVNGYSISDVLREQTHTKVACRPHRTTRGLINRTKGEEPTRALLRHRIYDDFSLRKVELWTMVKKLVSPHASEVTADPRASVSGFLVNFGLEVVMGTTFP